MSHTRGKPYHPQTQGKIERWHRSLKNQVLLENYYLLGELEDRIRQFVDYYNHERYHESQSKEVLIKLINSWPYNLTINVINTLLFVLSLSKDLIRVSLKVSHDAKHLFLHPVQHGIIFPDKSTRSTVTVQQQLSLTRPFLAVHDSSATIDPPQRRVSRPLATAPDPDSNLVRSTH